MRVDVRPRQSGKTTDAIREAAEKWLYIVVLNRREQQRVAQMARDMGLDIPFPITFEDFVMRRWHARGIRGFIIDNLDVMVAQLAGVTQVVAVTLSQGDQHDNQ